MTEQLESVFSSIWNAVCSVAVMVAGLGVDVVVTLMRRTARSANITVITTARNVRFAPGHCERWYQCKK